MLETIQPLYIIGSPRSGTTMLQVLLGSHPKVASTVQLTLFDRYIGQWLDFWELESREIKEKDWTLGLPMLWSREQFDAFISEFLTRAYTGMMERKPGATHLLDKNPGYGMHVDAIKRYLPRSKFIHMIRDGRDVACSLVAAKESMGFGFQQHAEAGALWRNLVKGARQAAKFGSDYLEVRYEDFLTDNHKAYRAVLDFCGLPYDQSWLEQTIAANTFEKMKDRQATGDPNVKVSVHHYRTGKSGNWKEIFTPAMRYAFDLSAGLLLRELGYAGEYWWAESQWERKWLPFRHRMGRRMAALRQAGRWLGGAVTLRGLKEISQHRV
jgi:hypothetical protein